jgi:hypothetical protein
LSIDSQVKSPRHRKVKEDDSERKISHIEDIGQMTPIFKTTYLVRSMEAVKYITGNSGSFEALPVVNIEVQVFWVVT